MLERYLTDTLTAKFGQWIDNLDRDQVRLSAWKGQIDLHQVTLKKDALDAAFGSNSTNNTKYNNKHAPVEIAYGRVGHLQLTIPWTVWRSQLTTWKKRPTTTTTADPNQTISIILTDVNLLLTPRRHYHYPAALATLPSKSDDDEEEEEQVDGDKQQDDDDNDDATDTLADRIQQALDAELLKRVAESSTASPTKSWIRDRLASLLQNLTVTVRNIHIRYEDTGTCMGFRWHIPTTPHGSLSSSPSSPLLWQPQHHHHHHRYRPAFAVGVRLQEFTIGAPYGGTNGTNNNNNNNNKDEQKDDTPATAASTVSPQSSSSSMIRVVSAQALAVYWDSASPVIMAGFHHPFAEPSAYYEAALAGLQKNTRRGWAPPGGFAPEHAFVLDPFSPSLTLSLGNHDNNSNQPLTLRGRLPPCRLALSRNLLEDLGYLRKSYAAWQQSHTGLPEATLRRLAALRPTQSPRHDPRGWWRYVGEAIMAVHRQEEEKDGHVTTTTPQTRRGGGWPKVARLLAWRQQYIQAYTVLVQTTTATDDDAKAKAHQTLLKLEEKLLVGEVVAFRIHTYHVLRDQGVVGEAGALESSLPTPKHHPSITTTNLGRWGWTGSASRSSSAMKDEKGVVALKTPPTGDAQKIAQRMQSFYEMGQAIEREMLNVTTKEQEDHDIVNQHLAFGLENAANPVAWETNICCGEISLQVNDRRVLHRHRDKPVPVVRLSCAFSQEQYIYRDGSWTYQLGVGSFKVKDSTQRKTRGGGAVRSFPYLIGPKRGYVFREDEKFRIADVEYEQTIRLRVSRSQHAFRSAALGSTTTSVVRVLPLEICYLTTPVEALSRIFRTANVDFADDYQRLSSRLFAWRERQKQRLLAALSQSNKAILVNVDLWAPTIQIPESESTSSSVVLVDLGHLAFSNDGERRTHIPSMADHWKLSISQIQVQCTTVGNLNRRQSTDNDLFQQVIEPFSLNFSVTTRFHRQENELMPSGQDQILVVATLPRLVFDLNASIVRLLRRLKSQWNERRSEIQSSLVLPSRVIGGLAGRQQRIQATQTPRGNRLFQFRFVAPLLRLKFENDVDGRDCQLRDGGRQTTPILDLSLRGIEGELQNGRLSTGMVRQTFQAKLRSVDARDLYQRGGSKFSWLLSSITPDLMRDALEERESFSSVTDLVSIRYTSSDQAGDSRKKAESDDGSNRLMIRFHELFVEWNPDTIAAIFFAIKVADGSEPVESTLADEEDDIFFDAEEDEFLEVGSVESEDSATFAISEISSAVPSRVPSFSEYPESETKSHIVALWNHSLILPKSRALWGDMAKAPVEDILEEKVPTAKKLVVHFELSKLRINFNKETRHRRVFTAEVDHTSVTYSTRPEGGYVSRIILGNLTLADPQSEDDSTLYRELLGLKGDAIKSAGENASLLEMTMTKNPRTRNFADLNEEERNSIVKDESVIIDLPKGILRGCDMHIAASLSPMRFVYLQQLWFEIVDYFFEGVTGYEVWGNKRPNITSSDLNLDEGSHAKAVSFTRFEVTMKSPVILIPVTYCSTDFTRLETDSMNISNFYSYVDARVYGADKSDYGSKLQWFNNCSIKMNQMTLSSCTGRVLNNEQDTMNCDVVMNWPTGPMALQNKPKWHVTCDFDELRLSLFKDDYALLQSIIASNISEPSRHLEEWKRLQNLPEETIRAFERDVFVKFGYDQKDVTPSTFDVTVYLPLLLFALRDSEKGQIAVAQCKGLVWKYRKFSDLVSRQVVKCDINLIGREGDAERMMLSSHDLWSLGDETTRSPHLTYQSSTTPKGDNAKRLVIEDSCIHVGYKPWKYFASFFSKLPSPNFLSPKEVIQVGDRWYRIVEGTGDDEAKEDQSLNWIMELGSTDESLRTVPVHRDPKYTFDLQFVRPRIALKSAEAALVLSMETIKLNHSSRSGRIDRQVCFSGVELQAISQQEVQRSRNASLIKPMDMTIEMKRCNNPQTCRCSVHTTSALIQRIRAVVTFSDLVRAAFVVSQLRNDMNEEPSTSVAHQVNTGDADSSPTSTATSIVDTTISVDCIGADVSLVDDSGRHFADSQELVLLSMQRATYLSTARKSLQCPGNVEKSLTLAFQDLLVRDSLQSDLSPFRNVLSISAGASYESLLPSSESSSLRNLCGVIDRGIEINRNESDGTAKHILGIHLVEMQYNPSMVVAVQRFIGRLLKAINKSVRQPRNRSSVQGSRSEPTADSMRKKMVTKADIVLKCVKVALNKEHQGRCLLNLNVSDVQLSALRDVCATRVKGLIRSFSANDENDYIESVIHQENRPILRMRHGEDKFLEFEFMSFHTKLASDTFDSYGLPSWVLNYTQEHVSQIDDYLSFSVASMEAIYLSARTSELIDYLSNGLPGKGMGLTSRVAKGFVADRIQKKSFLQVNVEAPVVLVPKNESETIGIVLGGEVRARSWVEVDDLNRKLSLSVSRLYGGTYSGGLHQTHSPILSNIDVTINVSRDIADSKTVDCVLSDLFVRLRYSDFATLMFVLRENVSRKIDRSKWDNIEAAWENEAVSDVPSFATDSPRPQTSLFATSFSTEVVYASEARHIRYGQGSRRDSPRGAASFDVSLVLDDLSIVLRRDDGSGAKAFPSYDMTLFRAQGFEASLSSIEDGTSASLSIHRVFLFDTGTRGRRALGLASLPVENSVLVLVEGYAPPQMKEKRSDDKSSSQLILRVDRSRVLSKSEYRVSLVLNYLSVAALIVPIQEMLAFLRLEWPTAALEKDSSESSSLDGLTGENIAAHEPVLHTPSTVAEEKRYHIQLVLHNPQFIFAATESDLHSRALVLRGLAILKGFKSTGGSIDASDSLKVNADFQNVSSHIIPDSSEILCIASRHYHLVTECLPEYSGVYSQDERLSTAEKVDKLGVALLLPVTVGVEFEQTGSSLKETGTKRSVGLSMEPLSLLLSAEDILVIKAVTSRLAASKPSAEVRNGRSIYHFEVIFESDRLGLGLRRESGNIVVDASTGNEDVHIGDILYSINGLVLAESSGLPLSGVVERLREEPRPLRIGFIRRGESTDLSDTEGKPEASPPKAIDTMSADVSLSRVTVTLIDEDSSLLKGNISGTRISYRLTDGQDRERKVSFVSTYCFDYYNRKIWQWEPLVESCSLHASTEYVNPFVGPRLLSIEMGDTNSTPLSLNLSDAAASVLVKLRDWASLQDDSSIERVAFHDQAGEAAHAALEFAKRQKHSGGKPFVFRNKSGLSCAFAVQKKSEADFPTRSRLSLLGEYHGLQAYRDSEIHVVAPDSEYRFRVDRPSEGRLNDSLALRPLLTVAFQSIVGTVLEPLHDLQMVRAGEYIQALSHRNTGRSQDELGGSEDVWISWRVEVTDDKTILTLASTLRISSQLQTTSLEVGYQVGDGHVGSLGSASRNEDLYLPVWLSLKPAFQLLIKPKGPYKFSSLFEFSSMKPIPEGVHDVLYMPCKPSRDDSPDTWIARRVIRQDAIVVITVDCCLRLLNLFPIPLAWEVSAADEKGRSILDGSLSRDGPLQVGSFAEVLGSQHDSLSLRLRSQDWCSWVALSCPLDDDSSFQNIALKDTFGVPIVVGLRTRRQAIGLEVTLYAETWFLNTTSMNINFGAPADKIFPSDNFSAASSGFEELTTAEAALKEISALFETGEGGKNLRAERPRESGDIDICLLPLHSGTIVTEECFEYIEVQNSTVKRRWWGSENPRFSKPNLTELNDDGANWRWIDSEWLLDRKKVALDGWESAAKLKHFRRANEFNPEHKFRRRRWYRRRLCEPSLTTAFYQNIRSAKQEREEKDSDDPVTDLRFALRVEGGGWALTTPLPPQGVVYGAIRAASDRNIRDGTGETTEVYELCYAVAPLEGEFGELSRLMTVSSRFLVRNDSEVFTFEVKQVGTPDSTARVISPGESSPFHWSDRLLPALICVRPIIPSAGQALHKWTGGFDPLTIGVTPLRVRSIGSLQESTGSDAAAFPKINSVKSEAAIRPRSGGAGINISFKEEDFFGKGCLFRIDNGSPFPLWVSQDGMLANPSSASGWHVDGDMVKPGQQFPFALDVPFRQGKYKHRKAASIEELLRVRLSLAPLSSRVGIESTMVVSMVQVGETVRLNPLRLPFLSPTARRALGSVRIIGVITNDGPTRVLNLVAMKKQEKLFPNPFKDELLSMNPSEMKGKVGPHAGYIIDAAETAAMAILNQELVILPEDLAVTSAMIVAPPAHPSREIGTDDARKDSDREQGSPLARDLIISLRVAFTGFTMSLIDSAPSEIATITLKNVNAIATWNTQRKTDSTIYFTVAHFQVDNMVPNAPYPVAVCPIDHLAAFESEEEANQDEAKAPLLVIGVSLAPRHHSGVEVIKSVTIAPKSMAIRVDLAFLVRLQKYFLDLQNHFWKSMDREQDEIVIPNLKHIIEEINRAARSGEHSRMFYFGGLTILPCSIELSVAPSRALTSSQANLEGTEAAAIHQAVRKGDVKLGQHEVLLGVKIGHRNDTPLAVVRGLFKSIVVDALLRLDGASLDFNGVSLTNHVATGPQLATYVAAHYMNSLRKNVPALVGSLAALGNPLGLIRGIGSGASDFVLEPVKGFQRSVQEMDASYLVDGVARGTLSLARHTVGGFANSAAALTETFSKNMTVLTLDRRYAQKRDREDDLRAHHGGVNVAVGVGSGIQKLVHGFLEGVTGVVRAPIRGAEKRGFEGFAKGIGKGLLGLLVKPLIGISDGLTDVMIGVQGSVDGSAGQSGLLLQIRPRRALYGRDRVIRPYNVADAAAMALMQRTRIAGEFYLSHVDMGDRLALLSVKRVLLLGPSGEELLVLKYKHIERAEMQSISLADGTPGWGIVLVLNTPRRNGSEVEVINCREQWQATTLLSHIEEGMRLNDALSSFAEPVELTSAASGGMRQTD